MLGKKIERIKEGRKDHLIVIFIFILKERLNTIKSLYFYVVGFRSSYIFFLPIYHLNCDGVAISSVNFNIEIK